MGGLGLFFHEVDDIPTLPTQITWLVCQEMSIHIYLASPRRREGGSIPRSLGGGEMENKFKYAESKSSLSRINHCTL